MTASRSLVSIIPSTRSPRTLISSATPSARSRASVPGLIVSPHYLSRGNDARSTMRTRAPARASTRPAIDPAGPAPTISTSGSPNDDDAVLRSEPEAVAHRRADVGPAPFVGNEIEIARRIGLAMVDGRRQKAARHRERARDDAGGAAGALRMTDHRLDRRPRDAIRVRAEELPDAARFDGVVEHGRRAVEVDVADVLERMPGPLERQRHRADDLLAVG